ncbi:MAG TPA: ribosome-binding factor A, partial [Burkholderiaceae bacterium]|nr:ribosome-binding factor A [Burkholderiaceae bacterium]
PTLRFHLDQTGQRGLAISNLIDKAVASRAKDA